MAWEPDYCTGAELKHFVRIDDTDDDAEVALAITGASRAIDLHCNRQFGKDAAPTTRYYRSKPCGPRTRLVKIDDVMTEVGMTVLTHDIAATAITYSLTPINNAAKGKPWTMLRLPAHVPTVDYEDVAVTATFGWTAVPAAVKEATLLQASRFLARREAPFGIAGSPDQGSEMRLLARVDPDVGVALTKYVRWWA